MTDVPGGDYWDRSVFVPLFTPNEPDRATIAQRLLQEASLTANQIVTSVFTIAETRRDRGRDPLAPGAAERIARFFARERVVLIILDLRIAERAAQIGEQYGLKPPDAVHLATALEAGCDRFLTWDDGYFRGALRTASPLPIARPG